MALVAVVVLAAYWPVLRCGAVSFDDDEYLLDNRLVQTPSWESAERFLSEVLEPSTVRGYYQPLAMISLMLDYAAGGRPDDLQPFHRTSLALHVLNSILVAWLLQLLFHRPLAAAMVALLFGVHPLAIESIAWVAERKTLLAAFFSLSSLVVYVRFAQTSRKTLYVLSLFSCVLALASKPTSTPLPVLMLLLDYWPLQRLNRRAIVEKVPFFFLAGLFALITIISQDRTYGTALPGEYSVLRIPMVICHNIVFYLGKILWPAGLSWYYAYPAPFRLSHPMILTGILGTAVLTAFLWLSLRWTRSLVTGFLFFFAAVLPTMGIVSFWGLIAADRFVYLPMVGPLLPLTCRLGRLWSGARAPSARLRSVASVVFAGIAAAALTAMTRHYLHAWQDSERLSRHMVALAPGAAAPHVGLANCLQMRERWDEAIAEYRTALQVEPTNYNAHNGLGAVLAQRGDYQKSAEHYGAAITLRPQEPKAYNNLGSLLIRQGRPSEAVAPLHQALALNAEYGKARNNLAHALLAVGRIDEAVEQARIALRRAPEDAVAHHMLGTALARLGRTDEALSHLTRATELRPDLAEAHRNLATVLMSRKRIAEAIKHYRETCRLDPENFDARNEFASALVQSGSLDEAILHWQAAGRLRPDQASVRVNLGNALLSQGRLDEAIEQFKVALRFRPDDADLHYHLGMAFVQRDRTDEGIVHLTDAVRLKPEFPEAHNNLGATLAGQGRTPEALLHYAEALRQRPEFFEARRNQAAALVDKGEWNEAAAAYEAALKMKPGSEDLRCALGDCLRRAGRFDEAIEEYRRVLSTNPQNEAAQSGLAAALRSDG